MTTGSVLDILIYVFDRYMLDEPQRVPRRERLARDLKRAGFATAKIERALDWLTELALGHEHEGVLRADTQRAGVRVFADSELARLSTGCRGMLLSLERAQVLDAAQRELVIERLLALDADEAGSEQLKWVVLMVLSSQPGGLQSLERLGSLVAEVRVDAPH
jgi:Smg protein